MPTTFYLSNGAVQGEPKPNVFVNPAVWTLGTATSYIGPEEGRLEEVNQGAASHRDMNTPATIGYYKMTRHYSKPLAAQTILAQTITAIMTGFEDLGTANAEWAIQIFVWKNDDTGVRGQLLNLPTQFTEMNADEETETSASGTSSELIVQQGDILCIEVYYYKTAAKAEVLSRHHFGPPDVTTYNSRIVFTNDVQLYVAIILKSFNDLGGGIDAFTNPFRTMGFGEVGGGSEVFGIPFKALPFTDTCQGTDAFNTPFRAMGFSDVGLGTDIFNKEILAVLKAFSDAGLGADSFLISFKALKFSDIGYGTDAYAIPFKGLKFSDSGLGSDVFTIPFKAIIFVDTGHGTDVFVIPFKTMSFSDVASGTDVFFLLQQKAFSDVGGGTDVFSKEIFAEILKAFADAGFGSDVFSAKHIHKVKLPFLIGMTLDGQLVWIFKQEYDAE